MRIRFLILPAALLALCLAGCKDRQSEAPAAAAATDIGTADRVFTASLEEELYFVDLIVRGTVREVGEPFNFMFSKVTPSVIEVEEVIHGAVNGRMITLWRYGTPDRHDGELWLDPGDEAILLLMDPKQDHYWPYSSGVGVWRIKDGRVVSGSYRMYGTVEPHLFDDYRNMEVDRFIRELRKAAENKKRPAALGE